MGSSAPHPSLLPPVRPGRQPVSESLRLGMLGPLAIAAGCLCFLLTVFSSNTDALFAWTMSPVTATLLGASYSGACAMLWLAARPGGSWVDIRVAVRTTALFMLLVLAASVLERGTLHLDEGEIVACAAAWTWLAVHLAAPLAGTALLAVQHRTPGAEPPLPPRLPWWVAVPVVTDGAALTGIGAVLFAVPGAAARHWPWAVTQLDVRVMGACSVAFGAALLLTWQEGELRRVRGGMTALVLAGGLGMIGLARYADKVHWHSSGAWGVVAVLVLLTGLGLSGMGLTAYLGRDPVEDAACAVRPR